MSECRGCGKPIVWGVTHEGKRIPMDPRAPVYVECGREGDGTPIVKLAEKAFPWPMVTHFATCPKANQFSASRTKAKEER